MPEIRVQFPDGIERTLFRLDDEAKLAGFYARFVDLCARSQDPRDRFQLTLISDDGLIGSVHCDVGGAVREVTWMKQDAFGLRWAPLWQIDLDTAEPDDPYLIGWMEAAGIERTREGSKHTYVGERPALERMIRKMWDTGVPEEVAELINELRPVERRPDDDANVWGERIPLRQGDRTILDRLLQRFPDLMGVSVDEYELIAPDDIHDLATVSIRLKRAGSRETYRLRIS